MEDSSFLNTKDFFEVVALLKKRWLLIGAITVFSTALGIFYAYTAPKIYTANAVLLPSESGQDGMSGLSRLQGLASLVGIPSSSGGGGIYYEEVFKSKTFMHNLAHNRFLDSNGKDSTDLYRILNIAEPDTMKRFFDLDEAMKASMDIKVAKTGVVELSFDCTNPVMAASVLNRMIDEFNRFYMVKKINKSKNNLEFVSGRLAEVEESLGRSERVLEQFVDNNRNFAGSPSLMFQWQKLQRAVKINEEMYLAIKKEHELAKIQEEKDRPVINVLDYAEIPVKKSGPKRVKIVALSFLSSLVFASALAVTLERFRRKAA